MSKIKKVSNIDKEIKVVDKWIKDIDDLHRSKPAPTIQYSKTMPEIDQLMQVLNINDKNLFYKNEI